MLFYIKAHFSDFMFIDTFALSSKVPQLSISTMDPGPTILQPQSVFCRHCWTEIAQKSWCPHAQVGDRPDVENVKTPRHHQKPKLQILEGWKVVTPLECEPSTLSFFFGIRLMPKTRGCVHLWQEICSLDQVAVLLKDDFWPMEFTIWDCWQIQFQIHQGWKYTLYFCSGDVSFPKRRVPSLFLWKVLSMN